MDVDIENTKKLHGYLCAVSHAVSWYPYQPNLLTALTYNITLDLYPQNIISNFFHAASRHQH